MSSAALMPARGRRPGGSTTRLQILGAARDEFAAVGFDQATVRRIASAAGVDAAMISHHFGSKQQLFMATLQTSIDPRARIAEAVAGPVDELGGRLVAALLSVWDTPAGGAAVAMLRTAVGSEQVRTMIRDFALREVLGPVLAAVELKPAERELRGALVVSQLLGLIFARYVFAVPPLAGADPQQVVATVGPTVQRYLTGPLTPADATPPDA